MGRKPKSKEEDKSHKQESVNPDNEVREAEPETDNPSLVSLKKKRGSKISTQHKLEEQEANHSKVHPKKTVHKSSPLAVRRSGRIQEAVTASENRYIEQIIEDITIISGSDKENEPADDEFSEPTMVEKEVDEQFEVKDIHGETDRLVESLQAFEKNIKESVTKIIGKSNGVGEVKYKYLYFDSQKKIEALMEENKQLKKKLECAHGEIEFYNTREEKMNEKLNKMRLLLSDSSNGTKAATETAEGTSECKTAKRKRGPN